MTVDERAERARNRGEGGRTADRAIVTLECARVEELVAKVVDREALEWEVEAVDAHTSGCASCAALRADLVEIGALVREPVQRAVAAADFSSFWTKVSAGIDALPRVRHEKPRVALFSWTMVTRLAAVASVAAVAFLVLPEDHSHHFAEAKQKVDVVAIEGGDDNTVMIYETPDDQVTFIWLIPETLEEKQPS